MYNQEILDQLIDKYGQELSVEICNIISTLYDIKYNGCQAKESLEEYDYERLWWNEASINLQHEILNHS